MQFALQAPDATVKPTPRLLPASVCGTKTISRRDIGLGDIFTNRRPDYLAVISSRFGVSIGSTPRYKLANVPRIATKITWLVAGSVHRQC
jgi:hypothetical protein